MGQRNDIESQSPRLHRGYIDLVMDVRDEIPKFDIINNTTTDLKKFLAAIQSTLFQFYSTNNSKLVNLRQC